MKTARHHLASLDAFRGMAIAGMILVNNPGSWNAVFPPLRHADWNGCTFADLVFPSFIFILGVAMSFAFSRRLASGHETVEMYRRIVRRAASLFGLGLILNAVAAYPALDALRIPGVLQRIGLVYLLTAVILLHADAGRRAAIAVALVAGHWALLTLVPFAGHAAGTLTPEINLAGYLDRLVFGRHTLASFGDPEGLLGTLPAVATALAGTLAGQWMRDADSPRRRLIGLVTGGSIAIAAGLAWSTALPLNKALWTGSYALFTAGFAALAFAACYWIIDVQAVGWWARPFVWLGLNPLAVYFLSELTGHLLDQPWLRIAGEATDPKTWLYWELLDPLVGGRLEEMGMSLLFALLTLAVWTAVAGLLYRRGVRIHV